MGGKQSISNVDHTSTTGRYRTSVRTIGCDSSESTPRTFPRTSAPPLPPRHGTNESSHLRHPPPPEPPPLSMLFSPPPLTPSHTTASNTRSTPPPLPPRVTDPLCGRPSLSQRQLANRPLPRLPSLPHEQQQQSSRRADRFLDIEALLAGIDEIGPPDGRRSQSLSHQHRSRHRQRRTEAADDILDPLSFLRSLTRTRRCPNCSEYISIEDYQSHLSSCSSKTTVQYNEDTLTADSGECSICLENMNMGDSIARLPCLCVYHIICIEDWFKVKSTCPQHPDLQLPSI